MLAVNLLRANSMPGANAQSVARYMAKQERDQVALAWHPGVTYCCKCFAPVMSIINVILLALSFIVYMAFTIDARLFLLGAETNTYTLVPWTVSSTINDMWNSGAWPISLLIIFGSCTWPVTKNIMLFAIWFTPKTFLNHESRMWWLVQLDILGKWSFLDVYIINILVCTLHFTLIFGQAPDVQVLGLTIPDSLLTIEVMLTPSTGIIMLATAAYMSLVVNHVIIWELRNAQWADRRLYKQIDGEQDDYLTPKAGIRLSISEYVFSTMTPQGQRDRYGPKAKNSIILLVGVAVVLLIAGYSVPYITFTYSGLVGETISLFIQDGETRTFSLFTIGTALIQASTGTPTSNATFLYFAILYFVTVVIAPVLQLLIHLFLWLRPMSIKDAQTVLFFAKVAAYWASLEVLCVALVATTIEIKPVTLFLIDFITSGACTALEAPLTYYLGEDNGTCLTPGALLNWGFYLALFANLFQIGTGAVMNRASGVAIRDRDDVLERQPHQQWTTLEYLVLDRLLVYGALHHKPIPDPDRKPTLFETLFIRCRENPSAACAECASTTCNRINICSGCCAGVTDVSLNAPVTASNKKVNNSSASKWNAPPSHSAAASSKWNNPNTFGAPPSANPSWNMSQTPKSSQALGLNTSVNLDSPNPVFAREQQKHYSVDV